MVIIVAVVSWRNRYGTSISDETSQPAAIPIPETAPVFVPVAIPTSTPTAPVLVVNEAPALEEIGYGGQASPIAPPTRSPRICNCQPGQQCVGGTCFSPCPPEQLRRYSLNDRNGVAVGQCALTDDLRWMAFPSTHFDPPNGSLLQVISETNMENCQATCLSRPECVTWAHNSVSRECNIYNAPPATLYGDNDWTIGISAGYVPAPPVRWPRQNRPRGGAITASTTVGPQTNITPIATSAGSDSIATGADLGHDVNVDPAWGAIGATASMDGKIETIYGTGAIPPGYEIVGGTIIDGQTTRYIRRIQPTIPEAGQPGTITATRQVYTISAPKVDSSGTITATRSVYTAPVPELAAPAAYQAGDSLSAYVALAPGPSPPSVPSMGRIRGQRALERRQAAAVAESRGPMPLQQPPLVGSRRGPGAPPRGPAQRARPEAAPRGPAQRARPGPATNAGDRVSPPGNFRHQAAPPAAAQQQAGPPAAAERRAALPASAQQQASAVGL
jgi:hypothetical protein